MKSHAFCIGSVCLLSLNTLNEFDRMGMFSAASQSYALTNLTS